MVVYQVFSRPQLVRHYATVCSEATLFQIFIWCLVIIPPFFVAHSTNGKEMYACIKWCTNELFVSGIEFWQYESNYREQPNVRYTRQLMVYLSDSHPGRDRAWGSFQNFIDLLDDNTITRPLVRVCSHYSKHVCNVGLFRVGRLTTTEMAE